MSLGHGLHRVGNKLPAGQRIFHSRMPHGNPITDTDCGELHRHAAGSIYPGLDRSRDAIEMNMAGNNLVG